jgi:hypothetical protein
VKDVLTSQLTNWLEGHEPLPHRRRYLANLAQKTIETEYNLCIGAQGATNGNVEPLAQVCVSSFCDHSADRVYERENGLLSQWRGYGRGGGFCIVLDTEKLFAMLQSEFETRSWSIMKLGEVVYSHEESKIGVLADSFIKHFELLMTTVERGVRVRKRNTERLGMEFALAAAFLKHEGFKEEREMRIAVSTSNLIPKPNPRLRSRQRGDRHVPYFALFENLNCKLPIKRVIVGPSQHQAESTIAARRILDADIKLVRSVTPFIE